MYVFLRSPKVQELPEMLQLPGIRLIPVSQPMEIYTVGHTCCASELNDIKEIDAFVGFFYETLLDQSTNVAIKLVGFEIYQHTCTLHKVLYVYAQS